MKHTRHIERTFCCRWCAVFIAWVIVFAMMPCCPVKGCEVTDVWLYLGKDQAEATNNSNIAIYDCVDTPYWFRVKWRAYEGPGFNQNGPFHAEVHDISKDISLWEDDNIADVDPGNQQEIHQVSSPAGALTAGAHNLRAYVERIDVGEWVQSLTSTVTFKKCTAGKKYVMADKIVSDACAVAGTIKTRYGYLCCEGCGTALAFNVAWVNLQKDTGGVSYDGQLGYGRQRNEGFTTAQTYQYWEVRGGYEKDKYDPNYAPTEGSTHTYKVGFDKSIGKWTFYVDGSLWDSFTHSSYVGITPNWVKWAGEIQNAEDDMPGTSADRCTFTDCKYWTVGAGEQSAGFTDPSSYYTSNSSEWSWEHVDGPSFKIWDKNPGQ